MCSRAGALAGAAAEGAAADGGGGSVGMPTATTTGGSGSVTLSGWPSRPTVLDLQRAPDVVTGLTPACGVRLRESASWWLRLCLWLFNRWNEAWL
jgi:hypothetical protein